MSDIGPGNDRRVSRRSFIKGGVAAGGLLGGGLAIRAAADGDPASEAGGASTPATVPHHQAQPNILVILVDQLRTPQWYTAGGPGAVLPPNIQRLREGSVSFAHHYTASNDCTPARATLLTGLYTHQTGCMITGGSTLDPGFPTWGTLLREHGYETLWYGKWHLTHHDNWWWGPAGERELSAYGFAGGTYPSPDGAPGQGWRVDPHIATQFEQWYAQEGGNGPWCTTVSFVNPHDIAWWYLWSDRVVAEATVARVAEQMPPNFETPEQLRARGKPRLQRSLQATAATSFGPVPFHGARAEGRWLEFMSLYVKLQHDVDAHVGRVLATLATQPQVAANTIVVFSSDHGEYAGSHGLRGKGASAYEEGIRVPLLVRDPRGHLTAATDVERTQLSSSVDVAPLLLTIASGSDAWRGEEHYAHLAGRLDLAAILRDPNAPGRAHVLHATDEIVTEFSVEPYAANAPLHVVAMRTPTAKYASYVNWPRGGINPLPAGREYELYDYGTAAGRLELDNVAGGSPLEEQLAEQLSQAFARELREELPARLRGARERGFADYFEIARKDAKAAAEHRKQRTERLVGPLRAGDTAGEARADGTPVEAGGTPGRR